MFDSAPADLRPLLSVRDVAKYLGIHEMTVYRLAKTGKLPMFRIGGRWRCRHQDLINHGKQADERHRR